MTAGDPRDIERLRLRAEALCREQQWTELYGLHEQLRREDPQWWSSLWAPMCAVAARHTGLGNPRELLEEAIAGGFHQPEFLDEEFEVFAADEDWPGLLARMAANVAPPCVELLEWPTATPAPPLRLDRLLPDGEERLRGLLPQPLETAWPTALLLLDWVTRRWKHANAHVESQDAVEVLERVDAGERFACVEYSIVLSQALNACGIPARRVNLRTADHHTGVAKGHVVSEAWIDDFNRWVLLDGQNGAWWGEPGHPLGVLELHDRLRAGDQPPMNGIAKDLSASESSLWFRYFTSFSSTGITWAAPPFSPVFQEDSPILTDVLVRDRTLLEPDLAGISMSLVDEGGGRR